MVMQWTVNPPSSGTTGSIPVHPTNYFLRRVLMDSDKSDKSDKMTRV